MIRAKKLVVTIAALAAVTGTVGMTGVANASDHHSDRHHHGHSRHDHGLVASLLHLVGRIL
jgi:hypothetical protein